MLKPISVTFKLDRIHNLIECWCLFRIIPILDTALTDEYARNKYYCYVMCVILVFSNKNQVNVALCGLRIDIFLQKW